MSFAQCTATQRGFCCGHNVRITPEAFEGSSGSTSSVCGQNEFGSTGYSQLALFWVL